MNAVFFETPEYARSWLSRKLTIQGVVGSSMVSLNGVQGYMIPGDLYYLFNVGLNLPENGSYLEIGSWAGLSAITVANGCLANVNLKARIYCIDTWKGSAEHKNITEIQSDSLYQIFLQNIHRSGMGHFIKALRGNSTDIAQQWPNSSLDTIFIDGDHSFQACLADIKAWFPKIKPPGRIIGHDATPEGGVRQALVAFSQQTGAQFTIYPPPTAHYIWEMVFDY